jgi:hypothetical protein
VVDLRVVQLVLSDNVHRLYQMIDRLDFQFDSFLFHLVAVDLEVTDDWSYDLDLYLSVELNFLLIY